MPPDSLKVLARLLDSTYTLIEKTTLTDMQRQFAVNIQDAAQQLRDLLMIIPNFPSERANHLLAYEGRSHLSNIIGYAETLLDEYDGTLDGFQKSLMNIIYNSGNTLVVQLNEMVGSA